jgi:hypothetical protein
MPLSYALGSFIEMLRKRPHLVKETLNDERLFRELKNELNDHPHLDKGGQVKRDLDEILGKLDHTGPEIKDSKNKPKPSSFWKTLPGILTSLATLIGAVTGLYLAFKPPSSSERPTTPTSRMGAVLEFERMDLFPLDSGALAQVFIDVNGTEFRYPSIGGIEWSEIGPGMSSQQFLLPSAKEYQIRFRAILRVRDMDKEILSQETKFVTNLPFTGTYALHEREGSTRAAAVRAIVSFSLRAQP